MQHAETVTFGGSALDRAAELRGNPTLQAEYISRQKARNILFWRGKPLVHRQEAIGAAELVQLPVDHSIFSSPDCTASPILLGRDENECLIYARDISAWQPANLDEIELARFLDTSEQVHPALVDLGAFVELRSIMSLMSPRDAELAATAKAVMSWHSTHKFCAKCGEQSEVAQSGWQRSCPNCGGQHFPRTDPVVIMLITYGNDVLVGRSPGWPEGMYSLLAGFMEPGETIEAAVRREVQEETQVKVGPVEYLASQPWAFPSSLMIGCKGEALTTAITLDPVELEDALWISREEMMDIQAGAHETIKPARKGAIAHFLIEKWLSDQFE